MTEPIPIAYHGHYVDDEDTRAVDAALQKLTERYNETPGHLLGRLTASFVLTMVMNQPDPLSAWEWLKRQTDSEIKIAVAVPEGSA
jgi:hypothetical protein